MMTKNNKGLNLEYDEKLEEMDRAVGIAWIDGKAFFVPTVVVYEMPEKKEGGGAK